MDGLTAMDAAGRLQGMDTAQPGDPPCVACSQALRVAQTVALLDRMGMRVWPDAPPILDACADRLHACPLGCVEALKAEALAFVTVADVAPMEAG